MNPLTIHYVGKITELLYCYLSEKSKEKVPFYKEEFYSKIIIILNNLLKLKY
jgi:hypothetical protein